MQIQNELLAFWVKLIRKRTLNRSMLDRSVTGQTIFQMIPLHQDQLAGTSWRITLFTSVKANLLFD